MADFRKQLSGAEKRKRKAEKVKDVAKQEGSFLKFLRPETQDDRCLTVKCYDYEAEPGRLALALVVLMKLSHQHQP